MPKSDSVRDRVTVAIPLTGVDEYLSLAVASVLNQTHSNLTLLLYGDGVDARERKVLESLVPADSRLIVYSNPRRQGLAAVLNHVAHLCDTEYLFRMDSDDVMHPERVERQLLSLRESNKPERQVVASGAYVIDEDSKILGRLKLDPYGGTAGELLGSSIIVHPTVASTTDWFRKNPYNTDYARAQDKELWLRSWERTDFTVLPDPLMFYRIPTLKTSKVSLSSAYNRKIIREYGPSIQGAARTYAQVARDWVYCQGVSWAERFAFVGGGSNTGRFTPIAIGESKNANKTYADAIVGMGRRHGEWNS